MTSRYAVVESGSVSNVILWDGVGDWPFDGTPVALPDDSPVGIGWDYDGTTFSAPPAPPAAPLTPAQIAATAIAAGLTITSTSTPAISGRYPVDQNAQLNIAAVTNYVLVNGVFPGGQTILAWEDSTGSFHIMPSVAVFKEFATAVADYVAQTKLYAAGATGVAMPSSTVTIS